MRRARSVLIMAAILGLGLSGAAAAKTRKGKTNMELTSAAFKAGEYIPKKHSCEGEDLSPALSWSGVPAKARSLALIMDDPDAPPGIWVHWVLYDIPASLKGLPEGVARKESLPDGSRHGLCWGVAEFDRVGYFGPCPPPGKPHHYSFRLYALDQKLGLAPRAAKADLLKAMKGHVLAQAELVGLYKR